MKLPVPPARWTDAYQRGLNAVVERALSILNPLRMLPGGGTTGQVLSKIDSRDFNVEWTTGGGGAADGLGPDGDKGDITVGGTGTTLTIDADAVTFAKMQNITTDRLLGRDTAATGNVEEIALNATLEFDGALALRRAALTGDVTASAGSNATVINLALTPTWTANHIWLQNTNGVVTPIIVDNDSNGTANAARIVINSGDASFALYTAGSGLTSAIITNGPVGAQAVLRTLGNYPLVFGTNNTFRWSVDGDGSWTDGAGSQGSAGHVWTSNGAAAAPSWQAAGGGGASATTVEKDLGSTPVFAGKFTITDAAISGTSKVMCWQAPGPYTGKGTLADEAEMQPVQVISVEPGAGSAVVKWQTPPMTGMVRETQAGRLNAAGATFDRMDNQRWPDLFRPVRIGRVRGNVKFSYLVFA